MPKFPTREKTSRRPGRTVQNESYLDELLLRWSLLLHRIQPLRKRNSHWQTVIDCAGGVSKTCSGLPIQSIYRKILLV